MYSENELRYGVRGVALESVYFAKVYAWMFAALVISGLMALFVATSPNLTKLLILNRLMFFALIIGELLLVIVISGMINRMTAATAAALFVAYAILNGTTLSVIFLAYKMPSIAGAFFMTAGTFGVMSLYGYFTKRNLASIGSVCFMALIGLIIASVVNIFLQSSMFNWIVSIAGILIFVGLTAYDTQKIKNLMAGSSDEESSAKIAILGALTLYLDFINLFLFILRLMGRKR
jgi:FtsH-binding integral membrane protein